MAKIKIKKIKSEINRPSNQKLTLLALGLRKIGQIVEHEDTPSIVGMVEKVKHLVQIVLGSQQTRSPYRSPIFARKPW